MSQNEIFVFDERTAREVVDNVRKIQREIRAVQATLAVRVGQPVGKVHLVKNGSTTIPAMSGTTPGEGTVDLFRFDSDQDIADASLSRTVYNIGNQPIAANAYGLIWQEQLSGRFVTTNFPGIVRFQLTEALVLGLEADAVTVEWDGAAYDTTANAIVVKDYTAIPGSWSGPIGRNGWAWLPPDNEDGKYEIVWMENTARFIEFVSTEDMGYTTAGEMEVTVTAWYDIKQPSATVIATDPRGLFTRAKSGAKGIAWYNPKTDKYVIVECQSSAGWIQTTLTANMASNQAAATVQEASGSQQDVQDPDPLNAGITLEDQDGLFKRALNGAKGIAIYDAVLDDYTLVECQSKAGQIEFTLTAALSGGSAACTVNRYFGTQQDVQQPVTVTVYDDHGCWARAPNGAKGMATYDAEADKYRVVWVELEAIFATATLNGACAGTTTGVSISSFSAITVFPFSKAPGSTPTTVTNPRRHHGLTGKAVLLMYNGSGWEIVGMEKVAAHQAVKVGGTGPYRVNGNNIEAYMVDVAIEYAATPTWQVIVSGTACP